MTSVDSTRHDLLDIINRFSEIDMHQDENNFSYWLAKKKQQRSHSVNGSIQSSLFRVDQSSSPSSKALQSRSISSLRNLRQSQSLTLANLQTLQPEVVSLILEKSQKNQKAYEDWIAKKESEQEKRLHEEQLEKEIKSQEETEKCKRKEARSQQAYQAWLFRKNQELIQKIESQSARSHSSQEEIAKQLENKQAFENWKKEKMSKKAYYSSTVVRHQKPWVDIPAPQRDLKEEILSPPHMYEEYQKYSKIAPEYLRKYKVHVASAGKPFPKKQTKAKSLSQLPKKACSNHSLSNRKSLSVPILSKKCDG